MSGLHYSIRPDKSYFLTTTVVDWIDVFTRKNHQDVLLNSLRYCQKEMGLNIYAWCLMPSHLHFVVNAENFKPLDAIIRDFKKYTSKQIIFNIQNDDESRREWMLELFKKAGKNSNKIKNFKFWQDGNHAIELYSEAVTWQKITYIHNNPVEAGLVEYPWDYKLSSARNYQGMNSLLDVHCLVPPVWTVQ